MPQPASAAFLRLRNYIAKQMRMSPIDQPLTLMELLGRSSPAPAQDVARRILGSAWWARFTFNGITAYGNGATSLIGGDDQSDAFREQRGVEVFAHRSRLQSSASTTWSNWSARAGMLSETICQMVSSSRPK